MKTTVVVPTYHRADMLRSSLESILGQVCPDVDFEVLVVDNECSAGTEALCREMAHTSAIPLRYIKEHRIGLHFGRHTGAQASSADVIVYLDDDIFVQPGWLAALLAPLADPANACVGGKVIPLLEGPPPPWLGQFDTWYLGGLDLGDQPCEVHWPFGANGGNMAIRRHVLFEVGGFNPDAFGAPADVWLRGDGEGGLMRRLYDFGYQIVYEPKAVMFHRVPCARLQPRFFFQRAFKEGISASFTRLRTNRKKRTFWVRSLLCVSSCLVRLARRGLTGLVFPSRRIRALADSCFWYGFGMHHIRVLANRQLRTHVFRNDYLS